MSDYQRPVVRSATAQGTRSVANPVSSIDILAQPDQSAKLSYMGFHKNFTAKMFDVTKAKNDDYTGINESPFANLELTEKLGNCSTEQGIIVRMSDKLSRLASFAAQGQLSVKDESVEDTLLDLANYCVLLAGYLKAKTK